MEAILGFIILTGLFWHFHEVSLIWNHEDGELIVFYTAGRERKFHILFRL